MVKGRIFDIKRFAVHDGPGIRTTIFFKGCPMMCQWCHNPEGIDEDLDLFYYPETCMACGSCIDVCQFDAISEKGRNGPYIQINREICTKCGDCSEICPTESLKRAGKIVDVDHVFDIIKRSDLFYETSSGGVTFSGGEPFHQYDFLRALIEGCKEERIHITVDTSGHVQPEKFETLISSIDLFLYDLKIIDEKEHQKYTGVTNKYVIQNLKSLSEKGRGKDVWIRFPAIPDITMTESNITKMIDLLLDLKGIKRIDILPFHDVEEKYKKLGRPYLLSSTVTGAPTKKEIEEMAQRFREEGFEVHVGG